MIGRVVRVSDPGLIQFFYPDFVLKDKLSYADIDANVIYTGNNVRDIKSYLRVRTKNFISVVGIPDLDFNNRTQVIEWLQERKNKKISVSEDVLESYDDEYFIELVKMFWVSGRWMGHTQNTNVSIYNLFQAVVEGNKKTLSTYFTLIESVPPKVVEAAFITFLGRVLSLDEQNVKPRYMMLLKQVNSRCGNKIKPALLSMALRKDQSPELSFINLITDLR